MNEGLLTKSLNDINAFATENLPTERENELVMHAVPAKGLTCVIIHKRFVKKNASTNHREFVFDCTVLECGAKVVEYPMAMQGGTVLMPLSHSLFDDDAICRYAYHQGKTKLLVSGLKSLSNFMTIGDEKLMSVSEGDIEEESGDEDEFLTLTQLGEKHEENYVGV